MNLIDLSLDDLNNLDINNLIYLPLSYDTQSNTGVTMLNSNISIDGIYNNIPTPIMIAGQTNYNDENVIIREDKNLSYAKNGELISKSHSVINLIDDSIKNHKAVYFTPLNIKSTRIG